MSVMVRGAVRLSVWLGVNVRLRTVLPPDGIEIGNETGLMAKSEAFAPPTERAET